MRSDRLSWLQNEPLTICCLSTCPAALSNSMPETQLKALNAT